jgi:hypothetical protein
MQESGVVVMVIDDLMYGLVAKLIRRPVGISTTHSTSSKPHAEAISVVIATDAFNPRIILNDWEAAHFTSPMDERGIEQAAPFKILH